MGLTKEEIDLERKKMLEAQLIVINSRYVLEKDSIEKQLANLNINTQ